MKNLFYLCFLLVLFCSLPGFAQTQAEGKLTGIVQDDKQAPIAYANVAVLDAADKSLVTGAVTDASGKFNLKLPKEGKFELRITAIGYAEYRSPAFEVESLSASKDFGNLSLKEDVETLKEVEVKALRPTITQEADRMVVSVEGTALAAGSTAFDVLAKSPGVFIDQDGNIQLNGKAGVQVMLDGRLTYLSAKDLQTMMEGMSAENIKNIEIIANPSARFDAEGASGIININLKKNSDLGLNGSVYAGYQYNGLHGYSAGANVNLKKGRWNSFVNIDAAKRARRRIGTFTRVFNAADGSTYFDQQANEDVVRYVPSVRMGTDFDLTDRHSIGAMVNLSYQDASYDFRTDTYIGNNPADPALFVDADNRTDNIFANTTLNLHYLGKLDTLGTTLSADLDYVRLTDDADATFSNYFRELTPNGTTYNSLLASENPTGFDIYSFKVDFVKPLANKRRLELGAKVSQVVSDNDLRFFIVEDAVRLPDASRSNHFIYSENIYAAYINYNLPLGSRFTVQAGLRAEQTVAEGESKTTKNITERNYLNLFPSLFVQQKVSENYQINYNYSRRIQRPEYEQLNPFIFYLDPYTWAKGNPLLRPQYTHSVALTQTFKQTYNLSLEYQLIEDFIAEVPQQNIEDNTTVFNRSNVDDAQNLSATLVAPVKILKGWDTNNTAVFSYQEFSTILNNELVKNDRFFYLFQSNHNIALPKQIRMEVNAGYQGPLAWGLYKLEANWWVNLGFKRSFMDDILDLSLSANDIFRTQRIKGGANVGGNINQFNQYFSNQSINVSLRYRFNKGQAFDAKRRNNRLEEVDRAGGS